MLLEPTYRIADSLIQRTPYVIGGRSGGAVKVIGSGAIQSINYLADTDGWSIDGNGNVEFNSGVFRGQLIAGSIDIPDMTTASSMHVDSTGFMWIGANVADKLTAPFRVTTAGVVTVTELNFIGVATLGTGGVLRTDASGQRSELVTGVSADPFAPTRDTTGIIMYSGHVNETNAGYLTVADDLSLRLRSPSSTSPVRTGAVIIMDGDRIILSAALEVNVTTDDGITADRFQAGNGTAADPAFTFFNDLDIGMYRFGANKLGWSTAATARMTLDSGVLSVSGDFQSVNGRFYGTGTLGTVGDDYMQFSEASDWWRVVQEGGERLRSSVAGDLFVQTDVAAHGNTFYFGGTFGTKSTTYINFTSTFFQHVISGTEYFRVHGTDSLLSGALHINEAGLSTKGTRAFSVESAEASEMYRESSTTDDGIVAFYSDHGGGGKDLKHVLYVEGDAGNEDGTWGSLASDRRIKRNIAPLAALFDPVEALRSFEPRRFDKIKKITETEEGSREWYLKPLAVPKVDQFGWVAQEAPEWFQASAGGPDDDFLRTRDSKLIPVLHAGWHYHDEEIAKLKARVKELEAV